VRKTSAEAAAYFAKKSITFDLIHIDGNHDTALVMQDVENYLPLLKQEGFIVMDDVSWESVKPAYDQVAGRLSRIFQRVDTMNDYAVFWKTTSQMKCAWMRFLLSFVGKGD
jgi:predicted O-methyltransferase YrrM